MTLDNMEIDAYEVSSGRSMPLDYLATVDRVWFEDTQKNA